MASSPLVLGPMLRYTDETCAAVWVETDAAAEVSVRVDGREWRARTFAVHDHHYALVELADLAPASVLPYEVRVNGEKVWPEADSTLPAPVIATLAPQRPLRMAWGSCRTSVDHDKAGNRRHGVDAMRTFALALSEEAALRPDLILLLGDQVYADVTTKPMQDFIRSRRDIDQPPGKELKDYEEYAHLYRLAWSDDANRWLLSTVPSAMIFDDHDVRETPSPIGSIASRAATGSATAATSATSAWSSSTHGRRATSPPMPERSSTPPSGNGSTRSCRAASVTCSSRLRSRICSPSDCTTSRRGMKRSPRAPGDARRPGSASACARWWISSTGRPGRTASSRSPAF